MDKNSAFEFWCSLKRGCVALFCLSKQQQLQQTTSKLSSPKLISCIYVLVGFSAVSLSLSWRLSAWGAVGATSCCWSAAAPVGLHLLIKVNGKLFHTITMSWRRRDLRMGVKWWNSEPSSSHKQKQLNAVSQEQIVKRTLNVIQMPGVLQCISHGEAFFLVLIQDNSGETL